jgi:hypothetical protein
MTSQYNLETFLYIHTDEDLIRIAGNIIGTQKLRLTVVEAVECIRNSWDS